MKLHLHLPFSAYLNAKLAESLDELKTNFQHGDYQVSMAFGGSEPIRLEEPVGEHEFFKVLKSIDIQIQGGHGAKAIDAMVQIKELESILAVVTPIVNRVFRAIRNYGFVSNVDEIRPRPNDARSMLSKWAAEVEENGNVERTRLISHDTILSALLGEPLPERAFLRAERWPLIEEAIQDNLEPGPEREFLTNSLQHLQQRNYRLALLEAVICLDIVLNTYLNLYLSISKNLSKTRIEKVLNSQVGLTARVGLLLELVLNRRERGESKIEEVLAAIRWRNHIVHKTGRLPTDLKEDMLTQGIWATLELAQTLSSKRDDLASTPEANALAAELSESLKVRVHEVQLLPYHRVTLSVYPGAGTTSMSDTELLGIVDEVIKRCRIRDARFVPEIHLSMKFSKGLMGAYAIWNAGKLERLPETQSIFASVLPPPPLSS